MVPPRRLEDGTKEEHSGGMRSRPVEEWKNYNVTARDIAADASITVTFDCEGCRLIAEFNIWKVGAVLADTPLQRMRFRCKRCGVYPTALKISRRTSGIGEEILIVDLNPACWDDEHRANQHRAMVRAHAAWKAKGGR